MTRKMKDSGIEWIGEIPEDWEIAKLKYTSDSHIPHSFEDGDWIESKYISEDGIRYLTTGNIGDGEYKEQGSGYVSEENFKLLNCKYAYSGDLILSRLNAPYGRSCILPKIFDNYVIAVDNVILRPSSQYDKKFINYITQCSGYQKSVEDSASGTTMQRISRTKLGNIPLAFPDVETQKIISIFLNKKTKQIEYVKNTINKEIEDLESYKKSVITEAVTKGLDKNVEMKDSGIEWIGEIPKHWKISKIKQQYKVTLGKMIQTEKRTNNDTLENYLSSINIKWGKVDTSVLKKMWFSKREKDIYSLNNGDILISEGGLAGTTSIYNNEFYPCYIQNAVNRVTSKENSINKFLFYWMYFVYHVGYIESICNKATIQHYTKEKVENTPLIYMSIEDQRLIVNYLDKKTKLIDDSITAKQKQLEILEEYKKSLIYEYVTGKKEVKDGEET